MEVIMENKPVITHEIHVSNDSYQYTVSFRTRKECAFVKDKMNLNNPILETYMGRFNLQMNSFQYDKFLRKLTTWEDAGLIAVP